MATPRLDAQIGSLLRAEATTHIEAINAALLGLEQGARTADDALGEALRAAHSLKGAAAAVGLTRVERATHNWESCAQALVGRRGVLTPGRFDLLYRALDAIEVEVQAACSGLMPALPVAPPTVAELEHAFEVRLEAMLSIAPVAPSMAPANEVGEISVRSGDDVAMLRVATTKVDGLMNKVEELIQVRASAPGTLERSETLAEQLSLSTRALEQLTRGTLAETGPAAARTREALLELRRRLDEVARRGEDLHLELRRHYARLSHVADGLRDDVRSVRMVPVHTAFSGLPRLSRDVARKLERRVALAIVGESTEVDRDLLETVKDAVMHLVRNAIAHGIEVPAERARLGKPELGRVTVTAQSAAGGLSISVSDDGSGIDTHKVLARAVRAGLVPAHEAASLAREHVEDLVFRPGLSTSEQVDEISGRGVGLDAVRELVERAGGSVSLRSEPGRGSEFVLRMPLNLTTMRMLLVRVGTTRLAFASSAILKIVRIGHDEVRPVDGGQAIEVDGRVFPITHLGELLKLPLPAERPRRLPALLVASGSERAAVLVDAVDGELELIVKTLGEHLTGVEHIAGATVLPDGQIVPLVQAAELVEHARKKGEPRALFASPDSAKSSVKRILVVDDSITTRTLEKSILEASGYLVETATDGIDALGKLSASQFDLVLSDVQMPRLGGIELVRRIKANPAFRALPLVLVSSLNDPEDRRLGLEAGAAAYLGKGEFRQDLLLETLEKLL